MRLENTSYTEDEPSIFTQQGDSPGGAHNTKYVPERIYAKEIPQFQQSLRIYSGGRNSTTNPRASTESLTPLNLATENITVRGARTAFATSQRSVCQQKMCSKGVLLHAVKRGFRPSFSSLVTE